VVLLFLLLCVCVCVCERARAGARVRVRVRARVCVTVWVLFVINFVVYFPETLIFRQSQYKSFSFWDYLLLIVTSFFVYDHAVYYEAILVQFSVLYAETKIDDLATFQNVPQNRRQ